MSQPQQRASSEKSRSSSKVFSPLMGSSDGSIQQHIITTAATGGERSFGESKNCSGSGSPPNWSTETVPFSPASVGSSGGGSVKARSSVFPVSRCVAIPPRIIFIFTVGLSVFVMIFLSNGGTISSSSSGSSVGSSGGAPRIAPLVVGLSGDSGGDVFAAPSTSLTTASMAALAVPSRVSGNAHSRDSDVSEDEGTIGGSGNHNSSSSANSTLVLSPATATSKTSRSLLPPLPTEKALHEYDHRHAFHDHPHPSAEHIVRWRVPPQLDAVIPDTAIGRLALIRRCPMATVQGGGWWGRVSPSPSPSSSVDEGDAAATNQLSALWESPFPSKFLLAPSASGIPNSFNFVPAADSYASSSSGAVDSSSSSNSTGVFVIGDPHGRHRQVIVAPPIYPPHKRTGWHGYAKHRSQPHIPVPMPSPLPPSPPSAHARSSNEDDTFSSISALPSAAEAVEEEPPSPEEEMVDEEEELIVICMGDSITMGNWSGVAARKVRDGNYPMELKALLMAHGEWEDAAANGGVRAMAGGPRQHSLDDSVPSSATMAADSDGDNATGAAEGTASPSATSEAPPPTTHTKKKRRSLLVYNFGQDSAAAAPDDSQSYRHMAPFAAAKELLDRVTSTEGNGASKMGSAAAASTSNKAKAGEVEDEEQQVFSTPLADLVSGFSSSNITATAAGEHHAASSYNLFEPFIFHKHLIGGHSPSEILQRLRRDSLNDAAARAIRGGDGRRGGNPDNTDKKQQSKSSGNSRRGTATKRSSPPPPPPQRHRKILLLLKLGTNDATEGGWYGPNPLIEDYASLLADLLPLDNIPALKETLLPTAASAAPSPYGIREGEGYVTNGPTVIFSDGGDDMTDYTANHNTSASSPTSTLSSSAADVALSSSSSSAAAPSSSTMMSSRASIHLSIFFITPIPALPSPIPIVNPSAKGGGSSSSKRRSRRAARNALMVGQEDTYEHGDTLRHLLSMQKTEESSPSSSVDSGADEGDGSDEDGQERRDGKTNANKSANHHHHASSSVNSVVGQLGKLEAAVVKKKAAALRSFSPAVEEEESPQQHSVVRGAANSAAAISASHNDAGANSDDAMPNASSTTLPPKPTHPFQGLSEEQKKQWRKWKRLEKYNRNDEGAMPEYYIPKSTTPAPTDPPEVAVVVPPPEHYRYAAAVSYGRQGHPLAGPVRAAVGVVAASLLQRQATIVTAATTVASGESQKKGGSRNPSAAAPPLPQQPPKLRGGGRLSSSPISARSTDGIIPVTYSVHFHDLFPEYLRAMVIGRDKRHHYIQSALTGAVRGEGSIKDATGRYYNSAHTVITQLTNLDIVTPIREWMGRRDARRILRLRQIAAAEAVVRDAEEEKQRWTRWSLRSTRVPPTAPPTTASPRPRYVPPPGSNPYQSSEKAYLDFMLAEFTATDSAAFLHDGLHPTRMGHALIAQLVFRRLTSVCMAEDVIRMLHMGTGKVASEFSASTASAEAPSSSPAPPSDGTDSSSSSSAPSTAASAEEDTPSGSADEEKLAQ